MSKSWSVPQMSNNVLFLLIIFVVFGSLLCLYSKPPPSATPFFSNQSYQLPVSVTSTDSNVNVGAQLSAISKKLKRIERLLWQGANTTYEKCEHMLSTGSELASNTPEGLDIREHVPVLYDLASKSTKLYELGVRTAVSSWPIALGLLHGAKSRYNENEEEWQRPIHRAVDLVHTEASRRFADLMQQHCLTWIDYEYAGGDDLQVSPINVDGVFIDTLHDYRQVFSELELYAPHTNRWIAFHDTTLFANDDESERGKLKFGAWLEGPGPRGLWPAITKWMDSVPEGKKFQIVKKLVNNNGFTIVERKSS